MSTITLGPGRPVGPARKTAVAFRAFWSAATAPLETGSPPPATLRVGAALGFGLLMALLQAFSFQEEVFLHRLGFWTAMMGVWVGLVAIARALVRRVAPLSIPGSAALAIALAIPPMAGLAWYAADGPLTLSRLWTEGLLERLPQTVLVAFAFEWVCAMLWTTVRQSSVGGGVAAPTGAPSLTEESQDGRPSALLARLPAGVRGPVVCLQMEDHYVRVHTVRGSALVLMRFSDAISELGPVAGLRVHRSWWIASRFIAGLESGSRSVRARLSTGQSVPVSRPYVQDVRAVAASLGVHPDGGSTALATHARTHGDIALSATGGQAVSDAPRP